MFKLPSLQPQLTGTAGVEGRSRSLSSYSAFLPNPRSLREGLQSAPPGHLIEVKSWESQAKEITADMISSEKYKSLSLHAEVKLAEALEKCTRVSMSTAEEKPNRLKTAVCCQLLGEFSDLCGPFSGVLKSLRDELLKSVYSGYYVSERGTLVFDQLTWFAVAERLEREKEAMLEEREKFQQQLSEQQECLQRIEEQLGSYQRSMLSAQMEAASMKARLESLLANRDSALLEAKTGREELKKTRKEWLKMKDELDGEREAHSKLKDLNKEASASYRQQLAELENSHQNLQHHLAETRKQLDMSIPVEAIEGMRSQLEDTSKQLEATRAKAEDLQAQLDRALVALGSMTPRPSCPQLQAHGIAAKGGKTQDTLSQAAVKLDQYLSEKCLLEQRIEELSTEHAALQQQMELMEAVLLPDPLPRSVQLSVTTDSSAYFITEEEDAPEVGTGEAGARALSAEGLGLSQDIPRCLRWPAGQTVKMKHMDKAETEKLVASIWQAKQEHDQKHIRLHLLSFVYEYFARLVPGAAPEQESLVQQSYSLLHACSTHAASSASVQLFSAVMTGHLSEQAWADRNAMMTGLLQVLAELPRVSTDAELAAEAESRSPCVSVQDVSEAIQHYFPTRGQLQLRRLTEGLSAESREDAISLASLRTALQPWQQHPEPANQLEGDSIRNQDAASFSGSSFTELLAAQHLEELEAFGDEVAAAVELEQARASDNLAGNSSSTENGNKQAVALGPLAAALQSVMPRDDALRCIETVAGLVGFDRGVDLAVMVDAQQVLLLLRALCMMRPERSYDVAGALAWARSRSSSTHA